MKKQITLTALAFVLLGIITPLSFAGSKPLQNQSCLPQAAITFINQHFPNESISYVLVDRDVFQRTYEVMFTSGKELEFNRNGTWKEIDTKGSPLPHRILINAITRHHVKEFGNQVFARKVERNVWGYELQLSNGLEAQFTKSGRFIRYDD